ncbi:MAG: hypothetical protein AAB787_00760 [Patescibacteria group bacterium]
MKKNSIKLLFTVIVVVFVGFVLFYKNIGTETNTTLIEALSRIFPGSKVIPQGSSHHFKVNSKDYFAKIFKNNNRDIVVTVENNNHSSVYSFYGGLVNPEKLIDVNSIPVSSEGDFDKGFFQKDITGDGIDEIFVTFESTSKSLNGYTILHWAGDKLVNLLGDNAILHFDEISYKDGLVAITEHDLDVRSLLIYQLDGSSLIPVRAITFKLTDRTKGDEYEVIKTIKDGSSQIIDRKKGNIWTDSFDPYE